MRAAALGAVVGLALGVSASLWSCSTDRVSDNFKCTTNADCDPSRHCDTGYCVIGAQPADAKIFNDAPVCPAICGGRCDFAAGTCTITATGSGSITCPTGWDCDISCPTPGACGAINCQSSQKCEVHCTADNACLAITCQTKDCTIDCTGTKACGNITCSSGNCAATCTGSNACGSLTCTSGNCTETCSGGGGQQVCGNLTCNGTGDCTRTCTGSNACASQSCSGDATSTCSETCSGSAACGTISCGGDKCTATCMGIDPSCGNVTCNNSCGCQVNCDAVSNTCPAMMTCPTKGNGANQKYCSLSGVLGSTDTACSFMGSGGLPQCNQCL